MMNICAEVHWNHTINYTVIASHGG